MIDSKILSEKSSRINENTQPQLWKTNDIKANKQGPHSKVYWVKEQSKQEDGTYLRVRWKINNCYQGNWKDNKKCGFGIQFFENGDKYEGEWLDNKKHGYGTYWVKNEKKKLVRSFTGQFFADHKNGKGTMYFSNGDRYDGHWENNEMSGFGRMVYSNGDVYVGHWANDERNGYGVFTKNNGDYYEGNWLMNKREGYGSYYFSESQKVIIGEWVNDSPKVSVLYKADQESQDDVDNNQKAKKADDINQIKNVGDKFKVESSLLPNLELEDPINVLQDAMVKVREERLILRIKHSPVECMINETELLNYFDQFEALSTKEEFLDFEHLLPFLGADDEEVVRSVIASLELSEDRFSFEDAMKIMIVMENLN
jgi:hypothetical protein